MTAINFIIAMLAGLGVCFIVFLIIGTARAINEWKYQRAREKQYADEWVRRHRINGEPPPHPVHRRQGGA